MSGRGWRRVRCQRAEEKRAEEGKPRAEEGKKRAKEGQGRRESVDSQDRTRPRPRSRTEEIPMREAENE